MVHTIRTGKLLKLVTLSKRWDFRRKRLILEVEELLNERTEISDVLKGSAEREKFLNQRNYAFKYYQLVNGQVFRKADPKHQLPLQAAVTNTEIFSIIQKCHVSLKHTSYQKTYKAVQHEYYGIVREHVHWLLKRCKTCLINRPNWSHGVLEPILSNYTLKRVQIDLIDMRHEPDG